MIRKIPIIMLTCLVIATSGCSADESNANHKSTTSKVFQNFSAHKREAQKFWELYEQGLEYQKNGRYDEAVHSFELALKDYSLLRPEQAAAAGQLVITLELAGDFERAIKYCQVAAEVTMNEDRRKYFQDKEKSLRQRQ